MLPSYIFAAAHIFNGHLDFFSTILLLVAGTSVGIMFTMIRIATGSIWAGVVVHSLWDLLIASENDIFSIVPSTEKSNSFYSYFLESKSVILSGGQYGLETSFIAIGLYLIVAFIIYYKINLKSNDNLLQ